MRKPLSPYHLKIILGSYPEMSVQQIADRIRRPYDTVYSVLYRHGRIEKRTPKCRVHQRQILDMYSRGYVTLEISEATGVTREECKRIIIEVFGEYKPKDRTKENNLTPPTK